MYHALESLILVDEVFMAAALLNVKQKKVNSDAV
jgi:hypothetical protein